MAVSLSKRILSAMQQPAFYPHAAASIIHRETHISHLFLTGDYVYKIKKAVNFGFLDFSTLEKRRRYCRDEVRLNRRLARGVYVNIVGISIENNQLNMENRGEIVEYAVKMKQLPDHCVLLHLLEQNCLEPQAIEALARLLVDYYEKTTRYGGSGVSELLAAVWMSCDDNFNLLRQFSGKLFEGQTYRQVVSMAHAFFLEKKSLFQDRISGGYIRDCHGDLRTDHIYFTEEGIQIIDCIEFNERLRRLDVISDLAFLMMDLDFRGFSHWSRRLTDIYLELTGDDDALILLNFYKCYRAIVRLKVSCLRYQDLSPDSDGGRSVLKEISRYLALAHHYAVLFAGPVLWVVCGMPASGKSTIAGALSKKLAVPVIRSDVVRKALFQQKKNTGNPTAFGQGLYSESATSLTYQHLFRSARKVLDKGQSVVLDATFKSRQRRREALMLARAANAAILFVECRAPERLLKERLKKRETEPSVSDARLFHFNDFKKHFEPLDDVDRQSLIPVDTSKPTAGVLSDILREAFIMHRGRNSAGQPFYATES